MGLKHVAEGPLVGDIPCPLCGSISEISGAIWGRLTVDHDGGMHIAMVCKSTPVDHICGRRRRYVAPDGAIEGQTTIDDHLNPRDITTPQDAELAAAVAAAPARAGT